MVLSAWKIIWDGNEAICCIKVPQPQERLGGLRPVLTKVAAECRVGREFVAKIEQELVENEVLAPGEIYVAQDNPPGQEQSSTRSPTKKSFDSTRRVGCTICMDIKGR